MDKYGYVSRKHGKFPTDGLQVNAEHGKKRSSFARAWCPFCPTFYFFFLPSYSLDNVAMPTQLSRLWWRGDVFIWTCWKTQRMKMWLTSSWDSLRLMQPTCTITWSILQRQAPTCTISKHFSCRTNPNVWINRYVPPLLTCPWPFCTIHLPAASSLQRWETCPLRWCHLLETSNVLFYYFPL